MTISRRRFLQTSAAALATTAFPSILRAAAPWAPLPGSALPKYKILEIHLPGGASQWENLWVSHDGPASGGDLQSPWFGTGPAAPGINWRGLGDFVYDLDWTCADAPLNSVQTHEFGNDVAGTPVSWGPATSPLWRPDIFNRCRMLVTQHHEQLHFSGNFRTVTGRRFGNPRGASLGAAVQRHFQSIDQQQEIPYSYVLGPEHTIRSYFHTFPTAIGNHPGPSRPLGLKVGSGLGDKLLRPGITTSADAIFKRLTGQYQDMLRWQGAGNPIRAADFQAFDGAGNYLTHSKALHTLIGEDQLAATPQVPCANDTGDPYGASSNPTRRSLEAAALLLDNGARHVTVIDGGFRTGKLFNGDMPYDCHNNNTSKNVVETTSNHVHALMSALADVIAGPGAGYGGPQIDLDETLIYLSTEFNRTPNPSGGVTNEGYAYCGREHFPSATVALLIGGPIGNRAIHGGIGLSSGANGVNYNSAVAIDALTPTDVHAGVMLAAGVNPIDADNFTAGDDFSDAIKANGNADTIRANLAQHVLGL